MKSRGYCCVALVNPKTNSNIGSTLRNCGVYDAAALFIEGKRYRKHAADTQKRWKHMPFFQVENVVDNIPYDCIPIGVEICDRATSIHNFVHPERAFYWWQKPNWTKNKQISEYGDGKLIFENIIDNLI